MTDVLAVADQLFAGIERGDRAAIEAVYDDDISVWNTVLPEPMDKARSLAVLDWLMAPGVTRSYDIHERLVSGDRLAQRHTLRVTVPGHEVIEMPVALFLTVADGLITHIDEYVDAKASDRLVEIVPRPERRS